MHERWLHNLRSSFVVDFERGVLTWAMNRQRPDLIGQEAGYLDNCGYIRLAFQGRKHLRSHLIFALFHGRLPVQRVDHIDRDRQNDRPENLREANKYQNMWNRTPKRRDLPMGVTERDGRFVAKLMCRRKLHYLGRYDTAGEAASVYQQKRVEMFGEYA